MPLTTAGHPPKISMNPALVHSGTPECWRFWVKGALMEFMWPSAIHSPSRNRLNALHHIIEDFMAKGKIRGLHHNPDKRFRA